MKCDRDTKRWTIDCLFCFVFCIIWLTGHFTLWLPRQQKMLTSHWRLMSSVTLAVITGPLNLNRTPSSRYSSLIYVFWCNSWITESCRPMVIQHRLTTVMNVGIIIVMNVSCVSHNCHYSTRDTRQHRDTSLTADHGAIMLVTKMFRQNKFLLSINWYSVFCFYFLSWRILLFYLLCDKLTSVA